MAIRFSSLLDGFTIMANTAHLNLTLVLEVNGLKKPTMQGFLLWFPQDFYLDLRKNHQTRDTTPITTRQLESLIRLAEVSSMNLRDCGSFVVACRRLSQPEPSFLVPLSSVRVPLEACICVIHFKMCVTLNLIFCIEPAHIYRNHIFSEISAPDTSNAL